jgi:hypothetical protein
MSSHRRISMRCFRAAFSLSAVAAATLLTLGGSAPAGAATGVAVVNGVPHQDPQGCISTGGPMVHVVNHTDQTAQIHPDAHCWGQPEGRLPPGGQAQMNGAGVYFP